MLSEKYVVEPQKTLEPTLDFDVHSPQIIRLGELGPKLTEVLEHVWKNPVSVQGDFARLEALHIAIGLSEGLLTTRDGEFTYGRTIRVTPRGLQALWQLENIT